MSRRARRERDFYLRASWDPDNLRCPPGLGEYIAIHPLADETDLLRTLSMSPSDCDKCDLYWKLGRDVYFVEVKTEPFSRPRWVGRYVRRNWHGYLNFHCVVAADVLDTALVERELRYLASSVRRRRRIRNPELRRV